MNKFDVIKTFWDQHYENPKAARRKKKEDSDGNILEEYEDAEAQKIRQRIVGSVVIPLGSIVVGGLIAVAIAQVFLNFHEYAPLFALIISAAILLFASAMSAAPKIKITKSEVLIASAGVLTLIIIIASVAASQH